MNRTTTSPRVNSVVTARLALGITLASESFFFGTLITAYLYMRGAQPDWPLEDGLARLALPLANTILLLVSALFTHLGHRAIQKGRTDALLRWFGVSLALGLVFVAGQVLEYTSNGLLPYDEGYGGVFFTLMGFHALHMLAGVVVHGLVLARARLGDFSAGRHTAVEIATYFWYYVVAVWAALFTVLYLV